MKSTNTAALTAQSSGAAGIIRKKIGNTVYRVSVHFSDTSKENLEDKLLRMAKNDLSDFSSNGLKFPEKCGIVYVPQTGRLLEGGSLI